MHDAVHAAAGEPRFRRRAVLIAAVLLLAALALQLRAHIQRASPTIDEPTHVLAGYRHLRCGDFGINPEHPPLAKLAGAAPLLAMPLRDPLGPCTARSTPAHAAFNAGGVFLAANGIDRVIVPARMAVAAFTMVLAVLVFLFAWELSGAAAALVALAIFTFEPVLLGHGSLVTTDVPLAATFFATVFAVHRYRMSPSLARLAVAGVAAGLTLGTKHSGLLVLPVVALLLWRHWRACLGVVAIAVAVLFATYGFQFAPYFEGLRYIAANAERQTWLFDRAYARGQWFYFPLVFTMKASIAMLVVTACTARAKHKLLLLAPAAFVLGVSMSSGINIGIRHLLAVWPLAIVAGAAVLIRSRVITAVVLLFHLLAAIVIAPDYIAYVNELWGGAANAHRLLRDSNVEWGQNTKVVRDFVRDNGIKDCWFAAYGHGAISRALQPCTLLPALGWTAGGVRVAPIPQTLRGTVFVSAAVLPPRGGREYLPIVQHEPVAILGGSVLVYQGEFHVRELATRVERTREQQRAR
jgi:Dolichyl-phosphate-mannose-protein mannosyltransferase